MQEQVIGIMGAMPEEIDGVILLLENPIESTIGKRTYVSGTINDIATVVVFSRWGKVAAAATVSTLIHKFNITHLLFTGVAGAVHPDLNIGDIVIAKRLVQHDMDARPLMERHEIPLLGKTFFDSDAMLLDVTSTAVSEIIARNVLHERIGESELRHFSIADPKMILGDIGSGDQFFAQHEQKENLHSRLPTILCVEMEGAAVAQVCYENDMPFSIIRTISDTADDNSHIDFPAFITNIASKYAVEIISTIYRLL